MLNKRQKPLIVSMLTALGLSACGGDETNIHFGLPQIVETPDYYLQHFDERSATLKFCTYTLTGIPETSYKYSLFFPQGTSEETAKEIFTQQFKSQLEKVDQNCANAVSAEMSFEQDPVKYVEQEIKSGMKTDELCGYYDSSRSILEALFNRREKIVIENSKMLNAFSQSQLDPTQLYQQCVAKIEEVKKGGQIENEYGYIEVNKRSVVTKLLNQERQKYADLPWQQAVRNLITDFHKNYESFDFRISPLESTVEEKVLSGIREDETTTASEQKLWERYIDDIQDALYRDYAFKGIEEMRQKSFKELALDNSYCKTDRRKYSVCSLYWVVLNEKQEQAVQDYTANFDSLKKDYNEQCVAKMTAFLSEKGINKDDMSREQYNAVKDKEKQIFDNFPCSTAEKALQTLQLNYSHYEPLN
ncbi:hypothetical protein [Lonepinella sp. BR2271]|uniref:hypothetical protein n=1 Tax=Lonepinella sp. BR2271 TaxID=3434550 RepID=UPI003F6DCBC2